MDINYFHQKETKTEVVEIVPEDIYNHEADECDKENEIQLPEVQVKLERLPTNIPKLALHLPQPIVKLERIKIEPNESESIPEVLSKSKSENVGNSSRSEALSESQSENAGDSSKSKASSESQSKDVCDSNSDNQSEFQLTTIPELNSKGHKKSKLKSVRKSNPQKVKGVMDDKRNGIPQKPGIIKPKKKKYTTKFQCYNCGYETYDKSNLTKHITQVHVKLNHFNCQFCQHTCASKRELDSHLFVKHHDKVKDEIEKYISHKIYKCQHCKYQCIASAAFNTHVKSIHRIGATEQFHCSQCEYTAVVKNQLDAHVRNKHSNVTRQKLNCQFCPKTVARKRTLANHILRNHRETLGDNFTRVLDLKVHLCDQCSYTTLKPIEMQAHKKTAHGVEPEQKFKCDKCQFESHGKELLRKHIYLHLNRKPFICLGCHKKFVRKLALHAHILKVHSDDAVMFASVTSKIYSCTRCSYRSMAGKDVRKHMSAIHQIDVNDMREL